MSRIAQHLEFLVATDALKSVLRKTRPVGLDRHENSAEHSWQVMLGAMVLAEHSNAPVDLLKVLRMLAVHDIPEILSGDTFHFAKTNTADSFKAEAAAARKIFSTLPEDQQLEFYSLWEEFEARITPEAKFASVVDRLVAFLLNPPNDGGTWTEFGITKEMILERSGHIAEGSRPIWAAVELIIEENMKRGYIK